jgi:dipeptidyl aminopeptidase/acylaminoacyl peptidase
MLERGSEFTDEWAVDSTGKIAARSELDETRDRFSILVRDGREWRRIYESRVCGKLWSTYIAQDRSSVIALGKTCEDARVRLWSLPLDGSAMKALVEDPVLDVVDVIVDSTNQTILGARLAGNDRPERWLDDVEGQRHAALRRSFGAEWISVTGRTTNNQRIVVRVEGPAHPPVVHLVDYDSKRADIINEMYPGLSGASLGTVSEFKYESRDDYALVARLTVPPGHDGKNLPLVVLPHDGPEDRDADVFDWEAQFLASRGYAVIQPQYRGSTGLGQAHADAGRRQWGLRMQDDVTDAGRAAISRGIADPKRVCVVGHGYGGYVALAGATFTSKMYACAASISGISDLPFMLGHIKRLSWSDDSPYVTYWREHIGNVSDGHVAVYSPSRSAANVRIPILLLHGEDDTTVPIVQSEVMARALKVAGKSHEFIELPDEDHWMSQGVTRIRMLTELEKFLAKNLASTATTN